MQGKHFEVVISSLVTRTMLSITRTFLHKKRSDWLIYDVKRFTRTFELIIRLHLYTLQLTTPPQQSYAYSHPTQGTNHSSYGNLNIRKQSGACHNFNFNFYVGKSLLKFIKKCMLIYLFSVVLFMVLYRTVLFITPFTVPGGVFNFQNQIFPFTS